LEVEISGGLRSPADIRLSFTEWNFGIISIVFNGGFELEVVMCTLEYPDGKTKQFKTDVSHATKTPRWNHH
jgi:hypothetical protein